MNMPERHRRKVARDNLKLPCAGCRVAGGMDHVEAARLLGRTTPDGCTCYERSAWAARHSRKNRNP